MAGFYSRDGSLGAGSARIVRGLKALAAALWETELANVVWMGIRTSALQDVEGAAKLHLARRLGIRTVATRSLWHGALLRFYPSNSNA